MLALATLIDVPDAPLAAAPITDPANGRVVYDAIRRPAVRFDRLPKLVTNPAGLFAEVYWPPPGITDAASAYAAADRLFPRIADVIRSFGGDATYGVSSAAGLAYAPADPALVAHLLDVPSAAATDRSATAGSHDHERDRPHDRHRWPAAGRDRRRRTAVRERRDRAHDLRPGSWRSRSTGTPAGC